MENENYYIEQTITFIIAHGLENIVRESLELNESVKIVNGENGSNLVILMRNDNKK